MRYLSISAQNLFESHGKSNDTADDRIGPMTMPWQQLHLRRANVNPPSRRDDDPTTDSASRDSSRQETADSFR